MRVRAIDHLVLNVANIEQSLAWYTGVLGLEPYRLDEWRRGEAAFPSARVNADTVIDFVENERTGENIAHVCLVIDSVDFEELADSGRFDVVDGPDQREGARGEGTSLYIRDPDGNVIELHYYG